MIIPKRIVEIRRGPELDEMQALVTLVLELHDGEILEIALPAYLLQK